MLSLTIVYEIGFILDRYGFTELIVVNLILKLKVVVCFFV